MYAQGNIPARAMTLLSVTELLRLRLNRVDTSPNSSIHSDMDCNDNIPDIDMDEIYSSDNEMKNS